MKPGSAVLAAILVLGIVYAVSAQPPDHFELFQNIPDPFCVTPDGGVTEIRFQLPMQSAVLLEVWNPDTTVVVRTLVNGVLMAGYHSLLWDGADDGGADLPPGSYPYSLTVTDPESGAPLFYDILVATIDCTVTTEPGTWGNIKTGFRKREVRLP
jgi:hypothetical protein